MTAGPALVLGIGNVLCRDDGAGVRVVQALLDLVDRGVATLPAGSIVLDGGTEGHRLAAELDPSRRLLVVDAVRPGGVPGAVTVTRGIDASVGGPLGELLAIAHMTGRHPHAVTVVGIEGVDLGPGAELTAPVASAVPSAIAAVLAELWGTGGRTA